MTASNLFADLPAHLPDELITTLLEAADVRIERIVSGGHASPAGFWYDQDEAEWVVVLQGDATLALEGDADPIHMSPGDHLFIPAHRRHRVDGTSLTEPTIWLAVFFAE